MLPWSLRWLCPGEGERFGGIWSPLSPEDNNTLEELLCLTPPGDRGGQEEEQPGPEILLLVTRMPTWSLAFEWERCSGLAR